MYIEWNGNVGIGTASPDAVLKVVDNGGAAPAIPVLSVRQDDDVPWGLIIGNDAVDSNVYRGLKFKVDSNKKGLIDVYVDGAVRDLALQATHNGKVGIGTASPDKTLHVGGDVGIDNNNAIYFKDSGGAWRRVLLYYSDDDIYFGTGALPSGTDMHFDVNGGTNAIFIKSGSGNVGVGTSNPGAPLHVYRGSAGLIAKFTQVIEGGTDYSHVLIYNGNPAPTAGTAPLRVGDSAGASIITTGNVGIGTTSPGALLEVAGEVRGGNFVDRDNTAYNVDPNYRSHIADLRIGATSNADNTLSVSGNADVTGKLGVGTTSPSAPLHVDSGSAQEVFRMESDAAPYFTMYEGDSRRAYVQYDGNSDLLDIMAEESGSELSLGAGGSRQVRIDSSGRVGVGTIDPKSKLAVSGLPSSAPDGSGLAGMLCITNDGNIWIDASPSTPCS